MTPSPEWICDRATIAPCGSAKFRLTRAGRVVDGLVVERDGAYYAYVNRCPHVGTPLDLWPNEFFADDGRTLVCATHGAEFEPTTGRCIAGPCVGDRLARLDVAVDADRIVVRCPDRRPR